MSRFRASLALPACAALAVLAACGGGGGTGVTPPGGSGGGTPPPTATPVSTSTPAPTPSPTESPASTLSAYTGYTVSAQTGPLVVVAAEGMAARFVRRMLEPYDDDLALLTNRECHHNAALSNEREKLSSHSISS